MKHAVVVLVKGFSLPPFFSLDGHARRRSSAFSVWPEVQVQPRAPPFLCRRALPFEGNFCNKQQLCARSGVG